MARDPRISEIFYYFESHTSIATGRTVGRKIGVVQEILCKKLLLTSEKINDCIIYEPKLPGLSGATHKVEFVLFQPIAATNLAIGEEFVITPQLLLTVLSTNPAKLSAQISLTSESGKKKRSVRSGAELVANDFIAESDLLIKIVSVDSEMIRVSVLDMLSPIASIESKRVGAQRFSGSDQLGSGIQTIEKVKQASLVAVDFDLKFNGTLLALAGRDAKRKFRSFVVLGNGVHWTPHDHAILQTYVDFTYLATDKAILRYADHVKNLAAAAKKEFFPFFMDYFQGTTKTPPDSFVVSDSDFAPVRPANAESFLLAVERQIQPYTIKTG